MILASSNFMLGFVVQQCMRLNLLTRFVQLSCDIDLVDGLGVSAV